MSMALSYSFYEYRSDQQYTSLEKSDMDFALFLFIVEAALALIYGVNHGVALDMLNSFTSTVIVAITYPLFLRAVLGAMHYAKYHTTAYP